MNGEQKFVFFLQSNNIYVNKLVAVFVYYSFQMLWLISYTFFKIIIIIIFNFIFIFKS